MKKDEVQLTVSVPELNFLVGVLEATIDLSEMMGVKTKNSRTLLNKLIKKGAEVANA